MVKEAITMMETEYGSDDEEVDNSHSFDFSDLPLKPDHIQRPCWTCPDKIIFLEAFHDLYTSAYEFLVAISEPVARPEYIHQYKLTPYSLYAAVATNIETDAIISVLDRLSKNALPEPVKKFIRDCTQKVSSQFHLHFRRICCTPRFISYFLIFNSHVSPSI